MAKLTPHGLWCNLARLPRILSRQAATTVMAASRSRAPAAAAGAAMITVDACPPGRPGAELCPRLAKLGGRACQALPLPHCSLRRTPSQVGGLAPEKTEVAWALKAGPPVVAPAGAAPSCC